MTTFYAFKNQLTSIKRHHTCDCNACQNVNNLDLKFFVHYGENIEQSIDDHHGLLGYAPMFVSKREWEEPAADSVGWHGYALFMEDSLLKLNLEPDGLEAVKFAKNPVKTFGLDLETRYEVLAETCQVVVSPKMADASLTFDFDADPPFVWEWLNDPHKRNQWWESFFRWTKKIRPNGRTGPGAINHCGHDVGDVLETILDWRPFDYYTVEMRITPGRFIMKQTTHLEPISGGRTNVKIYCQLQNPHLRWMAGAFSNLFAGFLRLELKRLQRLLIT